MSECTQPAQWKGLHVHLYGVACRYVCAFFEHTLESVEEQHCGVRRAVTYKYGGNRYIYRETADRKV